MTLRLTKCTQVWPRVERMIEDYNALLGGFDTQTVTVAKILYCAERKRTTYLFQCEKSTI